MISWIFSAIALGGALTATVVDGMRRAILSLWITGLAMGCLFLTMGAETLAILQWIISTLVAISLFFFAVMFGEYESKPAEQLPFYKRLDRKFVITLVIASVIGAAFAAIIHFGASEFQLGNVSSSAQGNDLASLGKVMVENHILSLEVLALTLFLVLVGGGVVARPESTESNENQADNPSGGKPC